MIIKESVRLSFFVLTKAIKVVPRCSIGEVTNPAQEKWPNSCVLCGPLRVTVIYTVIRFNEGVFLSYTPTHKQNTLNGLKIALRMLVQLLHSVIG